VRPAVRAILARPPRPPRDRSPEAVRARVLRIVELHRAGWSMRAIGREVGLDWTTVRHHLDRPASSLRGAK